MDRTSAELLDNASVEELARGGHRDSKGAWVCLYCGQRFEGGLVYPIPGGLALAEKALEVHVGESHGGAFAALLGLGRERTGLTEIQEKILGLLAAGARDKAIASALGGKSESTVRNHRYNLRRKAAEAKAILALMELVEGGEAPGDQGELVAYPESLPIRDERSVVTEAEAAAIEAKCLAPRESGGLRIVFWPKKQKDKLVVLRRVAELFGRDRHYTEPEVNAILIPVYDDHVTIRRYLIEYRFLDRKADGSEYWRV